MLNKLKEKMGAAKNKALVAVGLGVVATTGANAEVTFAENSGFSGTFDLSYFYSAIGIIVSAIAIVAAIGLALRQFRKI